MKLKIFNQASLPKNSSRSNLPKLSLGKAGTISLNFAATTLIGLTVGSKISVCQDEDDSSNWYLFLDSNGFEVRNGYDKKGMLFNHSSLTKTIVNSFGLDESATHSFKIAGKPTKVKGSDFVYWGLLSPVR